MVQRCEWVAHSMHLSCWTDVKLGTCAVSNVFDQRSPPIGVLPLTPHPTRLVSNLNLLSNLTVDWSRVNLLPMEVMAAAMLTHFAPDHLSLTAFFSYCATPDCPLAAGKQMLHTGIPSFANRNVILMRLVASFPLLFTISGDVLCLKFGGVWEMLWIFKVARWTHDWCTKINKSPTVSSSVRSSSFDILSAKLAWFHSLGTQTNPRRFKLEILLS